MTGAAPWRALDVCSDKKPLLRGKQFFVFECWVAGEKDLLEENLKSAEEAAKMAEAARQQLQGEAHLSSSSLRQRVVELEEDKLRLEAEAEENDALILQLQGRLEEKVQQVGKPHS